MKSFISQSSRSRSLIWKQHTLKGHLGWKQRTWERQDVEMTKALKKNQQNQMLPTWRHAISKILSNQIHVNLDNVLYSRNVTGFPPPPRSFCKPCFSCPARELLWWNRILPKALSVNHQAIVKFNLAVSVQWKGRMDEASPKLFYH